MHYSTQMAILPSDRFSHLHVNELSPEENAAVIRLAREVLALQHQRGTALTSPQMTQAYLQLHLGDRRHEVFAVLFLDNQHRVLAFEEMFTGTIDSAIVHPRVVAQRALELNAAAVILCHCHPSGIAEPSRADEQLTLRLREALALVDIRVLDHIVVSTQGTVSFADRGLL